MSATVLETESTSADDISVEPGGLPVEPDAYEPVAKTAFCSVCGKRFDVAGGEVTCNACVNRATRAAAAFPTGYTKCKVLKRVSAVGVSEDGAVRSGWDPGDVATFSDTDILSVPECFEAI